MILRTLFIFSIICLIVATIFFIGKKIISNDTAVLRAAQIFNVSIWVVGISMVMVFILKNLF